MWFFSFTKTENRRIVGSCLGGLLPVGGRRMWGEGIGGWIWYKYCVHMYVNWKMRLVETVPRIGEGGIKENDGGVNSTMIYCKIFGKCHNVPPVQQ
jgi:hypothetical protein